MARLYTKINVSGSWASLVVCEEERIEAVKSACEALAAESVGRMAFKITDGLGNTWQEYARIPALDEPHGWHTPLVRKPIFNHPSRKENAA